MEGWGEGGGGRGTIDGRENGRGIDSMLSGGVRLLHLGEGEDLVKLIFRGLYT